jgi:hypothetical protein
MKARGKILKLLLLLTASLSAILIALSVLLSDQVAEVILGSVNRNISTKISVGTFRLSLLKKFPRASMELRDVILFSSSGFDKDSFKNIHTDTLLVAENLSVVFKITDILKGVYNIERIRVRNGKVTLLADSAGHTNYRVSYSTDDRDSSEMTLNLDRILLSDIKISYNNLATKLFLEGEIRNGRFSSRITGGDIIFNAEADLLLTDIQQDKFRINNPFDAGLELKMENSKSGILLRKGSLSVSGFRFNITGSVSDDKLLNLDLSAEDIDLSRIRKYLPEKYLAPISDYDLSGSLQLNCQLTGPVSSTINPHLELGCRLSEGGIVYHETGMIIRDISFTGSYSNGSENSSETSSVSVNNFKAQLGSADYEGRFTISNFKSPVTSLEFTGKIFPGELKQYFRLNRISSASGYCDLKLRLKTDYWPEDSITLDDILSLNPETSVNFRSFTIGIKDNEQLFSNVTGEVFVSNSLIAKNLNFNYRRQNIIINGEFVNLPEWIAGHNVLLKADADIYFDNLIPETFTGKKQIPDDTTSGKQAFLMPSDILLDINLKVDSLKYEKLPSTNIALNLIYKQGTLTFNSLHMKSFNGIISGNGFISQNRNRSLMTRGSFEFTGINISNTFTRFHNFGQDFIKAENLAGNLTGTLSILLPLDSLLNPQTKSLVAEGRYVITEGALVDFEPVKALSSFIELSELENIRFERLENDFFIRNNSLYIPQMEVRSSAADLSLNGKHNFDNTFEYHSRILLSEILSKKRKKSKSNVTEFGIVEDDGLGRTSLLLKIESQGDKTKVGYDIKAAGNKVKNSIKSERQSLKTILNQEYGLYKSDTVPAQKSAEKKSRFRITWDESDTVKTEPESESGKSKKENALKNLLKKK